MNIKQTIITAAVALATVAMVAPVIVSADMTPAACVGVTFTRNLRVGATGSDVKCLQALLNTSASTQVATTGAGSPGYESTYFGPRTLVAVQKYQAAQGWNPAGQVGPLTRAKLNAWLSGSTTTTTPPTIGLVPGCTSTVGYSPITGASCATGTPTVVAGPVTVMLSSDNPASGTIVAGQATADLAHFTFTGTGTINSLMLKRSGISDQNTLSNVYLYNGNVRLTDGYSFNSNGDITINNLGLAVSGSTTIAVKADVLSTTPSGQTIAVWLTGMTLSGQTTMTALSLSGNMMQIASGSTLAGVVFNAANTVGVANVNAGTTSYPFWRQATQINTRTVWLKGANFRMIGSAPSDALSNIKFYVDGVDTGKMATVVMANGSNYAVFDFMSAPISLTTGSHTLEMRANIEKGSNRNVTTSIQQAADLMVFDPQVGVNIAVTSSGGGSIPSNAGQISILTGTATAVIDPAFQALTNITGGSSNAVIGKFKLHAYGEDLKVNSLTILPSFPTAPTGASGLDQVTLYFNGTQVGTQQNWPLAGGNLTYTLGSQMVVPAGVDSWLEVRSNIRTAVTNVNYTDGSVAATLKSVASNAQGWGINGSGASNDTVTFPTADVTGTTLTIQTGLLAVSKNSGYASQNANPNTAAVKLGSYVLQNQSSSESVRITSLLVAMSGSEAITNISALRTSETSGSGSTPIQPQASNTFSVDFTLAPGATKTIDIIADTSTQTGVTAITTLTVTSIGVSSNVSATSAPTTGQTISLAAGTITNPPTILLSSSTVSQYIAAAGGLTDGSKATFNIASTNGGSTINELKFAVTGTNTVSSIRVGTISAPVVAGIAYLTGLNIYVPNGGSGLNLDAWLTYSDVGTSGITSGTTSYVALTYIKYTSGGTTTTIQLVTDASGAVYTDADSSNTVTAGDTRRSSQLSASSAYVQANTGVATFSPSDAADEVKSFGTVTTGRTIILTETGAATNIIGAITGTLVTTDGWVCTARDAANGLGSATTTIASILSVLCNNGAANQVVLNTAALGPDAGVQMTTITLTTTTFASASVVVATDSDLLTPLSTGGIAAPTMTMVGSKPMIVLGLPNGQSGTSVSGLTSGTKYVADVVITANAKGDIKVTQIPMTFTGTTGTTIAPSTALNVKDATGTAISNFVLGTVTGNGTAAATALLTFTNGYTIAAGTSQTFRIEVSISAAAGTGNSVATGVSPAASFLWTDTAGGGIASAGTGTLITNFPTSTVSLTN